jgi:transcriptional regulator with XRE-family HTH domain
VSTSKRSRLIDRLRDAIYRRAFLAEHVQKSLPFQIRALREQRGWTQEELAKRCGKSQEWICKIESPNYGRFSLQTLLNIAAAFDVAFTARFVSYSELINWYTSRTQSEIPSFDADISAGVDIESDDAMAGQIIRAEVSEGPATLKTIYRSNGSSVAA